MKIDKFYFILNIDFYFFSLHVIPARRLPFNQFRIEPNKIDQFIWQLIFLKCKLHFTMKNKII